MKVLITGGAGFIGANFCRYTMNLHPRWQVVCFDKLTYAANLKEIQPLIDKGMRFVRGDIANRKAVYGLFEEFQFDCVVNFAAESHVDRSIKSAAPFMRTNLLGTQVLLDACLKFNTARFHQISTDEVYGDLPLDCERQFDECAPLRPSNPYSASKAAADLLILSYCRTYGIFATISRSGNNLGLVQHKEKLVPKIITNAIENNSIPIYGTGQNVRDWICVEDNCRAVDLILEKGSAGEVYNVGASHELKNIELAECILAKLNKPLSLIKYVPDRMGHDLRYALNASKIKAELGWRPQCAFENELERVIQYYKVNL